MMNGKEILLQAIRGGRTSRPAWIPFVGVHGASLLGINARDYLQSSDNLVAGLTRARELYQPDGLPIIFDLQMEAEILGCELHWAEDNPPSVMTHPLEQGSIEDLPFFSTRKGRYPLVAEAMRTLKGSVGKDTALYGLITGPFTLAMHLRGNELFLDMYEDEDAVKTLLRYCTEVGKLAADFYLEQGADVIAVVDPMTSQISPDHFETFMAGGLNEIFGFTREKGGNSSLFVCGDATRNLEKMAQTACDNLSVDENISLEFLKDLGRKYNKSFGGNLKLTTVLLMGTEEEAKRDALRCLDACGDTGFILAPGCDLPYAVPPGNLQAVATMVHDPYQRRVTRETLGATMDKATFEDIQMTNYETVNGIQIDVITLNSATCAPCQYMVKAARAAAAELDMPIQVIERKITTREGVAYMERLGVKAIPTICIQGKPAFSSIIPNKGELIRVIREQANVN